MKPGLFIVSLFALPGLAFGQAAPVTREAAAIYAISKVTASPAYSAEVNKLAEGFDLNAIGYQGLDGNEGSVVATFTKGTDSCVVTAPVTIARGSTALDPQIGELNTTCVALAAPAGATSAAKTVQEEAKVLAADKGAEGTKLGTEPEEASAPPPARSYPGLTARTPSYVCGRINDYSVRNQCFAVINTGAYFNEYAAGACDRYNDAYDTVRCMRIIADGRYGFPPALSACDSRKSTAATNECLSIIKNTYIQGDAMNACQRITDDNYKNSCFSVIVNRNYTDYQVRECDSRPDAYSTNECFRTRGRPRSY